MMEPQASLLVPGGRENMAAVDGSRGSLADDDLYASTNQSQPDDTPTPSTSQSQPSDAEYPSTSQSQDDDNPCPSTSQSCDSGKFSIKTSLIPQASNQGDELSGLGINVYNQEDLEQGIMAQVDQAMAKDEEERIKKLIERQLSSVLDDIRSTREELERIGRVIRSVISSNKGEISKEAKKHLEAAKRQRENKLKQMKKLKAKRGALLSKLDGQEMDAEAVNEDEDLQFFDQALSSGAGVETEGERLIKLGEMTPFGTIVKSQESKTSAVKPPPKPHVLSDFEMFLQNKDSSQTSKKTKSIKSKNVTSKKSAHVTASHETEARASEKLPKPNRFDEKDNKVYNRERDFSKLKGKRSYPKLEHNFSEDPELSEPSGGSEDEWTPGSEDEGGCLPRDGPSPAKKRRGKLSRTGSTSGKDQLGLINGKHQLEKDTHLKRARDDGNFAHFQKRLKAHRKSEAARKKQQQEARLSDSEDEETEFEGGLKVPGSLWKRLFGYQRTGVKWLWELHCQQAGGIVGDEMGLGKTIQTIAFLASLKTSKIRQRPFRYMGLGPTIIVCPATVMHQWVREFHKWWPEFRVAILHSSGSFTGTEESLIHNIVNQHGVLITSYSSLVGHQDSLLQHDWHYIFLDEGHKIRNPDAQATLACKQFRTPHRIILSGSPIQNNLKELWSLFDFVFPGKLGTLPDFMAHFSVPIVQGGYANATQVQVQTAYKCACILRDTIGPYLLRRMKADVKSAVKLPGKSEQVLFCRLTDEQRDVYQEYLDSKECNAILAGKYKVFAGLITLRKICNHPDISTGGPRVLVGQSTDGDESLEYGYWRRSGKLIVVESLLKLWKKQGHRVLLFSQSKQMLDILERFVNSSGYSYLRMDGGTTISSRQPLIHKYNSNPNIFLFLLTTRVGGLGVNLTGANRVVIFDPDWNPSTDMQARERAWRIGQHRQVTIYRLLTTGTIEEKIYHRQIFKQFLTNRVLKDPKQRRFFKTNDLFELFTLGNKDDQNGTETGAIFAGIGSEVTLGKRQNRFDAMKEEALPVKRPAPRQSKSTSALAVDTMAEVSANGETKAINGMASIPKIPKKAPSVLDRQEQLREMARKLSEKIGQKTDVTDTTATVDSKNSRKDREQKKKKKKKRVKDAEFEGEKIPHLAKLRDYQQSGEKTEESPENLSAQQDDYVLKRLFKKTGIQGALKHDVIVGASKTDYALVEGEAERVAREAAAALKRSRVSCRNALSGIPTWTGQHGQGGAPARPKFGRKKNSLIAERKTSDSNAPTPAPKNGGEDGSDSPKAFDGTQAGNRTDVGLHTSSKQMVMSSRELIQRMKARNIVSESERQSVEQEEEEQGGTTPAPPTGDNKDIDLITDIRNFIAFQCHMDGQASTQELLDEFGIKLPPGDSAKFKAMLRQICDFDRSSDVGIWRLKSVYR